MHAEPGYDPIALPRVVSRDQALSIGFTPDAIKHRLAIGAWTRVLPPAPT